MTLTGQLALIGLDEVLQVLGSRGRTGMLLVVGEHTTARITLRDGRVLYASSDARTRLGNALVEDGVLSEDELLLALAMQKELLPRQPLGAILVSQGIVPLEVLEAKIQEQVLLVFSDLLGWKDGFFCFRPLAGDPALLPGRGMTIQRLLLEGAKCQDEMARREELELWP